MPRQHSSCGKQRLGHITKRGDVYLRTLLVHGARSMLRYAERRQDRISRWALSVTHDVVFLLSLRQYAEELGAELSTSMFAINPRGRVYARRSCLG